MKYEIDLSKATLDDAKVLLAFQRRGILIVRKHRHTGGNKKGFKHSEATKAKMRKSAKARFAKK